MGYHTKQKERILDLLKTCAGEHLTVSDLGKQLEENGTPVGTATIYRYLEQLTEEGVLREIYSGWKIQCVLSVSGGTCDMSGAFSLEVSFLRERRSMYSVHFWMRCRHTFKPTIISRLTIPKRYFMDIVSSARMPSKKKNRKKQHTVGTISSCMLLVLLKCWRKWGCLLFRRLFIDANWGMV